MDKDQIQIQIQPGDHPGYMRHALSLARQSPPKPTNFRVGAVLVDSGTNAVLATGYTLELPGNTHAEQCCFAKLAAQHGVSEDAEDKETALAEEGDGGVLPPEMAGRLVLYTTMEPCRKRLSGNVPCVERIRRLARFVRTVYVGVSEPETFVARETPARDGNGTLREAGVDVVHVPGLEEEILEVATAGHVKS